MTAEDFFSLLVPVTFIVMLAIESLFRTGRPWPEIHWWRTKGIAFFIVVATINVVLPLLIPKIASHHLLDASRLGLVGSIVLGYLVLSLATATVHRAYHRYPLLWRSFHQLHHAPQRLDAPGAVVFTPLWGTFRNPERFMGDVGFEEAESQRFGAMLLARDVNSATLGPGSRGRTDPSTNPA